MTVDSNRNSVGMEKIWTGNAWRAEFTSIGSRAMDLKKWERLQSYGKPRSFDRFDTNAVGRPAAAKRQPRRDDKLVTFFQKIQPH